MNKFIMGCIWFLLSACLFASPLVDNLKLSYKDVSSVKADFEVEKFSAYLKKPVKSSVRLTVDSKKITWITFKPVKSAVTIVGGILSIDGTPLPKEQEQQVRPLIDVISDLVMFRFSELEASFDLVAADQLLTATPKVNSNSNKEGLNRFFEKIEIQFDDKNKLEWITLSKGDEKTVLHVRRIDVKQARP